MKLRNLFLSPGGQLVYAALQDSSTWEIETEYTIEHKPSRMVFWATSNFHPYRPNEDRNTFGWIEQWILVRAARRMRRAKVFEALINSRMQ